MVFATLGLGGCQTSLLKPMSGNSAFATVKYPIFVGDTQITVSLDGKTYAGIAGEFRNDTTGEQALRFGWKPNHKHRNIKQEMLFLFGTTTLTAVDGEKLICDHLKHGDDWRLRCNSVEGKEMALYRVKQ
jgi:hypothetical protein